MSEETKTQPTKAEFNRVDRKVFYRELKFNVLPVQEADWDHLREIVDSLAGGKDWKGLVTRLGNVLVGGAVTMGGTMMTGVFSLQGALVTNAVAGGLAIVVGLVGLGCMFIPKEQAKRVVAGTALRLMDTVERKWEAETGKEPGDTRGQLGTAR